MKSREEQLTWAKQRALICVDMGAFAGAVAGLRADLDNPLTKGVMSSDQARRGYKAAMDAALGRGSQALTEWIDGLQVTLCTALTLSRIFFFKKKKKKKSPFSFTRGPGWPRPPPSAPPPSQR